MPPKSKVHSLPAAVKQWLDDALVEGNFTGYETLEAELKQRGFDISKSSLHRYGQEFEERLNALKLATEQARAVVQASPDDDDAMNQPLNTVTLRRPYLLFLGEEINPLKAKTASATVKKKLSMS